MKEMIEQLVLEKAEAQRNAQQLMMFLVSLIGTEKYLSKDNLTVAVGKGLTVTPDEEGGVALKVVSYE